MTEPIDWDEAPEPIEVDLNKMSQNERLELLKSHIDESNAREIVVRIDGSAADYETSIARINQIVGILRVGFGTALKIARLA